MNGFQITVIEKGGKRNQKPKKQQVVSSQQQPQVQSYQEGLDQLFRDPNLELIKTQYRLTNQVENAQRAEIIKDIYESNERNVMKTRKILDEMFSQVEVKSAAMTFKTQKQIKEEESKSLMLNLSTLQQLYPDLDNLILELINEEYPDLSQAREAIELMQRDTADMLTYENKIKKLEEYQEQTATEEDINKLFLQMKEETKDDTEKEAEHKEGGLTQQEINEINESLNSQILGLFHQFYSQIKSNSNPEESKVCNQSPIQTSETVDNGNNVIVKKKKKKGGFITIQEAQQQQKPKINEEQEILKQFIKHIETSDCMRQKKELEQKKNCFSTSNSLDDSFFPGLTQESQGNSFTAKNSEDRNILIKVKQDYGGAFDLNSIQKAYDVLLDPYLVWQILKEISIKTRNVEKIQEQESLSGYDKALESMLLAPQNDKNTQLLDSHGRDRSYRTTNFWTKEIMLKFLMYDKKYDTEKLSYTQKKEFEEMTFIYRQKSLYKQKLNAAIKEQDQMEIARIRQQIDQIQQNYDSHHASMQKKQLGLANVNIDDFFLDLHNHSLPDAKIKVTNCFNKISGDLRAGRFTPNNGDGKNHIVKVVTGRGINSKNKNDPVLRKNIPMFIRDELGYDVCDATEQGVVLVRFIK